MIFCRLMTISNKYFRNTIRVTNRLDSEQDRCLQSLSADKKVPAGKERVKYSVATPGIVRGPGWCISVSDFFVYN